MERYISVLHPENPRIDGRMGMGIMDNRSIMLYQNMGGIISFMKFCLKN